MSRKLKSREYYEPWNAKQRTIPGPVPFKDGAPDYLEPEVVDRITSAHAKLVAEAEWLLWGSRMGPTTEALALLSPGELVTMDDRRIVASVRKMVAPEDGPSQEDVARRISACVNACAGIAEPGEAIGEVRDLLRDLANGETDRGDYRILALLARLIPMNLMEKELSEP